MINKLIKKYRTRLMILKENRSNNVPGDNWPYDFDIKETSKYLKDLEKLEKELECWKDPNQDPPKSGQLYMVWVRRDGGIDYPFLWKYIVDEEGRSSWGDSEFTIEEDEEVIWYKEIVGPGGGVYES